MKIIHNFLEDNYFKEIVDLHFSPNFSWFLQNGVNNEKDGNSQLIHTFFKDGKANSFNFMTLSHILNKLKVNKLIRVKSNLIPKSSKIIRHGFHTDFNIKGIKTAILYLNTNNGYTVFKNNKKIKSEENKMIIFDCRLSHSGTTCTDKDFRALMNINYT